MIGLGLDVATRTGWALVYTARPGDWKTIAGSFSCQGETYAEKIAELHRNLKGVVGMAEGDLRWVAIERPHEARPGQPMNLDPHRLHNAALGILAGLGLTIGRGLIPPVPANTWRKAFLGAQPHGTDGPTFKRLCKQKCLLLGIHAKNVDEAEAVGIAHWGAAQMQQARWQAEVLP